MQHPRAIALERGAAGSLGWLSGPALEGSTALSVNLPDVLPGELAPGHRLGFLHHNVAGVLAELNAAFADAGDNVVGQHLSTRDRLGYVVTDSSEPLSAEVVETLRSSEHCVWVRSF